MQIKASESTAAKRRVPVEIRLVADASAVTGTPASAAKLSIDGAAPIAATNTWVAVANGRYYLELAPAEIATAGQSLEILGDSATEAVIAPSVQVVNYDPWDVAAAVAAFGGQHDDVLVDGRWRLDGDGQDASGNGHTAVLGPSAAFTAGKFGEALNVSGNLNTTANVPSPIDTAESFSVGCWIKQSNSGDASQAAVAQIPVDAVPYSYFWLMGRDNYTVQAKFSLLKSGADRVNITAALTADTWTHICGVYDKAAKKIRLYVNGALAAQDDFTVPSQASPGGTLEIGHGFYNWSDSYVCTAVIDDVFVKQGVVTTDDLAIIMTGNYSRPVIDSIPAQTAAKVLDDPNAKIVRLTETGVAAAAARFSGLDTRVTTNVPAASAKYKFENNGNDETGNGNTLTVSETYAAGHSGQALNNAAENFQAAAYRNSCPITGNDDFSVAFWAYPRGTYCTLFRVLEGMDYGLQVAVVAGKWQASVQQDTDAMTYATVNDTASATLNAWSHVAAVWDKTAGKLRLYINKILVGEADAVAPTGSMTGFGAMYLLGSEMDQADGMIDELSLYQSALTDLQLAADKNGGSYLTGELVDPIATQAAAKILLTPANKLATDASGYVTATGGGGGTGLTQQNVADALLLAPSGTAAEGSAMEYLAGASTFDAANDKVQIDMTQSTPDGSTTGTQLDAAGTGSGGTGVTAEEVAAAILATPTNKLVTNASGQVEASNMRGTDNALLAANYTAPNNAGISALQTSVSALGTPLQADDYTDPPSANSIATAVWTYASRSLTTFGTLAADAANAVWSTTTRTLSAFGFTVNTADATSIAAIKERTDRIPDVPASQTDILSISNNTRVRATIPSFIQRPASGTTAIPLTLELYDTAGNMETPDATPTVTLANAAGTDLSARIGTVSGSNGKYTFNYTADATHDTEWIVWTVTVTEGGVARSYTYGTWIVDSAAVDFTAADRTKLANLDTRLTDLRAGYLDKLDVPGTLANTANADTFKADVSGLATGAALTALQAHGDTAWLTADVSGLATGASITSLQSYGDTHWATATGFSTPADLSALQAYGDSHWATASGFATPEDVSLNGGFGDEDRTKLTTIATNADARISEAVEAANAARQSVEGIQVADIRGPGSDSVTIEVLGDDGYPIADADVWITSTPNITTVVAGTLQSDSNGKVKFLLDGGNTYYLWAQKDGKQAISGQQFIAVKD